jgi:tetratricopeptide (TPR) repeat protein
MTDERPMREAALRRFDAQLAQDPTLRGLRYERALLLDALGRAAEARTNLEDELARDPMHFGALNNLAGLYFKAGDVRGARVAFQQLVDRHPASPVAHANLGFMLLKNGELASARTAYERAIALDPAHAEAHKGLGLVLKALGETAAAQEHAAHGFRAAPITSVPYIGVGRAPVVLAVVSYSPGNVHLQHFVAPEYFGMHKVVAEYLDRAAPLPPHDVVFNAVGDADICASALDAVRAIAERTQKRIVNAPDAVARTTRVANAQRLGALPGVRTARTVAFAREELAGRDGATALANHGFAFPLLLRAPGFHTGQHFERVADERDLAAAAGRMPGERLLAIEFVDVRGDDGMIRKYRAIFIGERIEPLHLAISPEWKVHYFSAEMHESAANRAEDAAFIADLPGVLGPRAASALAAIRATLGLDYGGIDFALDRAGDVVVFEANATMVVPHPKPDPRFAYRRAVVDRIHAAVRALIAARAAV